MRVPSASSVAHLSWNIMHESVIVLDQKSLTPTSIIHCEAWLHRCRNPTVWWHQRRSAGSAPELLPTLWGTWPISWSRRSRRRTLRTLSKTLKAQPHKIIMCKAFLRSDISDSTSLGCFKRGVVSFETVPEKHMKPILCQAFAWKAEEFCQIPSLKSSLKSAFVWATGQLGSFLLPEKEMSIDDVIPIYKDLVSAAGMRFRDINLAETSVFDDLRSDSVVQQNTCSFWWFFLLMLL